MDLTVKLLKHLRIIFTVIAAITATNAFAISLPAHKLKAGFIYNLVDKDMVMWNGVKKTTICVYGYDPLSESLNNLQMQSSNNKIDVKTDIDISKINECNLLYIGKDEEKNLNEVLKIVKGKDILTISDIKGFLTKGGVLGFEIVRKHVMLNANKDVMQNLNIKINPRLLNILVFDE